MTVQITKIVKSIRDSEIATLRIHPAVGESQDYDCIYKEAEAPHFFLIFPPTSLPENLNIESKCTVSFQSDKESMVISSEIIEKVNDRTLELVAKKTLDPISLREYFRVFYKTAVTASYESGQSARTRSSWEISGESVDLSGTGVLVIFNEEPPNKHNIFIDFNLPELDKSISCVGHVVRIRRIRRGRYQVAMHFDHITPKNRDAIITACLQEQRRQLRIRMQSDE
ncbi:MAG: PilZ domain-containing protein [Desulfobulbaceae bacterium]|nr:MAG: PilZ domain-containing protein [Desulfobulbaceae bacterium]